MLWSQRRADVAAPCKNSGDPVVMGGRAFVDDFQRRSPHHLGRALISFNDPTQSQPVKSADRSRDRDAKYG